jgi:hypothetical protein
MGCACPVARRCSPASASNGLGLREDAGHVDMRGGSDELGGIYSAGEGRAGAALRALFVARFVIPESFGQEVKADHLFGAAIGMGADMFWRLKGQLTRKVKEA